MIPDVGVRMPIRIRADGDMCRVVFPNRIAVDVMVVAAFLHPTAEVLPQTESY
jgi:hypothetical protein